MDNQTQQQLSRKGSQ